MDGSGFGHGFGGGFMWIFWILLIVILVWVVKMVADNSSGGGRSDNRPNKQESALDILNKRYARGEIDEEEYHRRKAELEK